MPKETAKVNKSLESWIWDAACSIRGAKDAPKYKDFILPLIFTKRLCDVFDDELNRIAAGVGSRKKAFQLAKRDHKLVRFFLPLEPADPEQPVWSVIRKLSDKIVSPNYYCSRPQTSRRTVSIYLVQGTPELERTIARVRGCRNRLFAV